MIEGSEIREAAPEDAAVIADIHLSARLEAMPWLHRPHTDGETRDHFAGVVGDRASAWWVAEIGGRVVGFIRVEGAEIDHLYVRPGWQRHGIGSALLAKAKALSPRQLELWTFQRNTAARAFYEAHGFHAIAFTEGDNEEGEPDVRYAWAPPP